MAEFVPDDVGKYWPKDQRDPDEAFAAVRAHCAVIGYNTRQVKAADAPNASLHSARAEMAHAHGEGLKL